MHSLRTASHDHAIQAASSVKRSGEGKNLKFSNSQLQIFVGEDTVFD